MLGMHGHLSRALGADITSAGNLRMRRAIDLYSRALLSPETEQAAAALSQDPAGAPSTPEGAAP